MLVNRHRRLFSSIIRLSAAAAAMLMVTILVVTHSEAAFSATTDNTTNSFSTGSVILTDDDGGATALFTAAALTPGVPVTECIVVTYSGTLTPADVRLYASSAGALAPYIDTTIEVGTGGSFGNCTGFTPTSTIFNSTLDAMPVDWATGLAVYTATANPDARTLRFTVDVQNDPLAQASSATADFTWEARD